MSTQLNVILHEIAVDGLPDKKNFPTGRVAFLWDGNIVNGWPITPDEGILEEEQFKGLPYVWEADSDPTSYGLAMKNMGKDPARKDFLLFAGVTHWIEFPQMLCVISPPGRYLVLPLDTMASYIGGAPMTPYGSSTPKPLRDAVLWMERVSGGTGGPYGLQLYRDVE